MKTLLVADKEFKAEKIIKTDNEIIGYNGNSEVFAFRGIQDFSLFVLKDGQVFDAGEIDELKKMIADLQQQISELTK